MRRVLVAAVALAGALAVAPALAAPAFAAPAGGVTDVGVQATCYYEVIRPEVNVRSGAGLDYRIVRVKYRGERVSGPCGHQYHVQRDGYWWAQVHLSGGGYAYMISAGIAEL